LRWTSESSRRFERATAGLPRVAWIVRGRTWHQAAFLDRLPSRSLRKRPLTASAAIVSDVVSVLDNETKIDGQLTAG
jgi:hypothetical protein